MAIDSQDTADLFVERLGLISEADGLPRIAGRIVGLLTIYGGPFSSEVLPEKLQVSKGSISTKTRLLEGFGVIERVTQAGQRKDFFRITPEPYKQLLTPPPQP